MDEFARIRFCPAHKCQEDVWVWARVNRRSSMTLGSIEPWVCSWSENCCPKPGQMLLNSLYTEKEGKMKRNILVGLVTALILGVSASNLLIGDHKYKHRKVLICHKTNAKDNCGVVIWVSAAALDAHLAHGDPIDFLLPSDARPGDPCGCRPVHDDPTAPVDPKRWRSITTTFLETTRRRLRCVLGSLSGY